MPDARHVTGAQEPPSATATPGCVLPRSIRIAVIGDYGSCTIRPELCASEAAVAHYVLQAAPDFIVTVGDDNYIHGEAGPSRHPPPGGSQPAHIANNNSRAFPLMDFPPPHETLPPPSTPGTAAEEAFPPEPPEYPTPPGVELYEQYIESGRFFIALGNHDWHQVGAGPAKAYFGQQGMGESHPAGLVEVFAVDTNEVSVKGDPARDPDIKNPPALAAQAAGVAGKINQSAACWKILYMHHPAYTRAPEPESHWKPPADVRDFIATVKGLTANDLDAVLSGHVHTLQFVEVPGDETIYVTNGKGGDFLSALNREPVPPGREVWAQPERWIWGFVVIDVTAADAEQPSIIRYTWHGVAPAPTPTPGGPPTPPVGQWTELWNHWTTDVRSATKTAQECEGGQNLTCNPGNCYSEG